ncbi:SusC/RagA family TonB-linked outer membrane protein [Zhouia amylolytica]|uniref:TonB-dependent receptor plug domain-containing protein n=1 Tax=Zhouia amylolytica AD3 TaxID=1286632 RepID=W2UMC1_9FLAO|nr:TonB-dependent receptor [Zhouia amylolytica]ETN95119.1 hypothetical protein P278_18740 [Zhouia amylolytica AD3]
MNKLYSFRVKPTISSSILLFFCLISVSVQANSSFKDEIQSIVKGQVTDESGAPIPGVNVLLEGTSTGVATDFDGMYEINISGNNPVLTFSYVGFIKQSVPVAGQNTVNVSLKEDVSQLDEVVVVGYGTQKKASMTSAVSTVDSKAIADRPVTNAINALQGTAAGLNVTRTSGQPGDENLSIQVRGVSSANGAVDPLLVVDGVSMSSLAPLQRMNPDDIESITILKDAAAAAIYGARAAGGVILVTTKTGTEGKFTVDYNGRISAQWALNVPERLSLLEEAEYSNLARTNAGVGLEYSDFDLENIRNGVEFVVDPNNPNKYRTYNQKSIRDQILRDQYFMQSHNLNVSGGSEKIKYLFSLGHLDQEGVFKVGPDAYRRWNLRSNVNAEISDHVSFDSKISYSTESKDRPAVGVSGYGLLQQVYQARLRFPIHTPDGKLFGGAGTSGNNTYAYLTEGGYQDDNYDELNGTFTLTIKDIVKGLKLRTIYGRQIDRKDFRSFRRTVELWDLDDSKPVYYLNRPNNYYRYSRKRTTDNFQFLADYDLTIAEKHKFHALVGYQWEDYSSSSFGASVKNLVSNDLPTLELAEEGSEAVEEGLVEYANQSLLGRINYNYDDKYLIEATIRSDESSRLAPGERTKWFYSVSAGWNMHREGWFKNTLPFISQFKPRFSWGQLGNANANIIGYYDYLPLISNGSGMVFGEAEDRAMYFYQGSIPSSSLGWETLETTDYGFDFGILKNKITGSFDYYKKTNNNMLVQVRRPATLGVGAPRTNEGELKSWGWEAALSYRDQIGDDFNFTLGFNISDNQNELINYGEGYNLVGGGVNGKITGLPLNTIWGYETVSGYIETQEQLDNAPFYSSRTGLGDIEYVDQNGDGRINNGGGTVEDHGDLVKLGSTQQRYIYGINLNTNWKALDFSIFLQGVGKRNIIPSRYVSQPLIYSWIQPMSIHTDYYTPDNPDAAFPRPFIGGHHNFATSDRWVLNAAYLRIKNMQLGYSIPEQYINKMNLSRVRLYLSAENVATFSKLGVFDGVLDPEQRNNAHADYPLSGSLAIGVHVSF